MYGILAGPLEYASNFKTQEAEARGQKAPGSPRVHRKFKTSVICVRFYLNKTLYIIYIFIYIHTHTYTDINIHTHMSSTRSIA